MENLQSFRQVTSPRWNAFVLQTVISTTPTVVVIALVPSMASHLFLPLAKLGTAFLLLRFGQIIGGLFSANKLNIFSPNLASSGLEILNFVVALSFWLGLAMRWDLLFFLTCLIKGATLGAVSNIRFSWLKRLPDQDLSKRILIILESLVQASYGLAGLLFLFGHVTFFTIILALFVDAGSSIAGAILFWSMRYFNTGFQTEIAANNFLRFPFRGRKRLWLLSADLSMALAMGGTNILLVEYGTEYVRRFGGYGTSLLIYSCSYLFAGSLLHSEAPRFQRLSKAFVRWSPALIFLGLLFLAINSQPVLGITAMTVVFISYPFFLLFLQAEWFTICSSEEAGHLQAYRMLLLTSVWGLGEFIYGWLAPGFWLRAIGAFLAAGALLIFKKQVGQEEK